MTDEADNGVDGGNTIDRVKVGSRRVRADWWTGSNKAVLLLQGQFAERKAVIVTAFDEGTRDQPYRHYLVAGVSKYPSKVI
ncbi:putative ribosomal protein L27e [Rosa chinensis]|uniref:Putative ribosomal protein L27e n=1 Tax=Rosa chinensis TaxID=74649 RepID=A0A2P6QGZ4_ROSCH|nr:putative ribosomal protein L27e [Rosa chinensis]